MKLPLECEAGRRGCMWLAGRRAGCRVGARWPGEVGAWLVLGGPLCEGECPRKEIPCHCTSWRDLRVAEYLTERL